MVTPEERQALLDQLAEDLGEVQDDADADTDFGALETYKPQTDVPGWMTTSGGLS